MLSTRVRANLAFFRSRNHTSLSEQNRAPGSTLDVIKPQTDPHLSSPLPVNTELSPLHLTTSELTLILRRRLENLHLPETAHLIFAERISAIVTTFSSLLFKVHLLQTAPATSLRETHRSVFSALRLVSLLQLPAPRLLIRPLLRYLPAFSWILAPFQAMSGAFLLDVILRTIRAGVQRHITPAPVRSVTVELNTLREHVRDGLESSRATVAQFMSDRMADLEKLKNEVEQKLRHDVELKLPPSIRPETPSVPGIAFRTPVKGRGFRTPVGPLAFRGLPSPRKGLVALSEEEEVTDVTSPGLALLPRSIARSVETPKADASPPDGINAR